MSWALGGLHGEPQEQLYNPPFELEMSTGDSDNRIEKYLLLNFSGLNFLFDLVFLL